MRRPLKEGRILAVGEPVLYGFKDRVAECTRHIAVESADRSFRFISQQIGGALLIVNRLIRDA